MAEHVSRFETARRSIWPHEWHPYDDYLTVHHQYMSALTDAGKVLHNGLSFTETRDGELIAVHIRGRIECASDVLIFIDKWLDVRRGRYNRYEVQGYSYSYHAWIRKSDRTLLRYDTAHGFDGLHRHYLNPRTGVEICEPIELNTLPTLTDFIEEALAIAADAGETQGDREEGGGGSVGPIVS